ncbi:hypothetical protein F5888DRAFT_1903604 [Russula emetica]|nr:hypothetical protein F5888DRAFT_1903604 [Russula emetica]
MATHVVSWGGKEHITLPAVSSTKPSIVSIDSVLPHRRETSSVVQEAPRSYAKHMSPLLIESSGSETSTSASTYSRADAGDDSFIRHHKYFFQDGNVTYLVDDTLYCVHRYFFSRDSVYFSTLFDQLGFRDHEALPITISLGNTERKNFDAFLSILYPENFEQHDLSYEEWKFVLHLSTRWDFASIRRLALNNIQPPTPHDRLLLARTYSIDEWVNPALSELCERRAPLSLDEARQMDIEDVVLVATVREDIRNHALQVDAADIPRCVEAAQAGKLVPPAVPTSGAVEHTSSLTGQKRASNGYESDGEAMEKQEAEEDINVRTEGLAQLMEDSQAEVTARYEVRVEAVRHMVKEEKRKAGAEKMKRKAEAAEREVEAARVAKLDVIGLEPTDTSHTMSRGGSGRNRATSSMSMPASARSASIGLGFIPGSMGKSAGSGSQMGQSSTSASKMSTEERFLASSDGRSASVSSGPLGSRPPAMMHTISQGDTGRDRTLSRPGANDSNRSSVVGNSGPTIPISAMGPPLEPVAPLEVSADRSVAGSTCSGPGVDSESPEMVERKVKALLNKLTMESFDSISDQIILVFEHLKAADEARFSEMYARLCRKMMEQTSPKVQDDGIKNSEGKPFAGAQLFRKHLLDRCQEDFERGWVAKEATAAAAATKATEDRAVKEANENTKGGDPGEESELFSEEYYAAAKAKRRGLGLIRFIGELFKLQMLTERIMHECIQKLLGNVENPEEEEIESLCKLLRTVGSLLDTIKARGHLDVYFSRMRELTKNKNVNSRMMFMLQDVIDLRERKWIPRNAVAAPTTIAQVHESAAKEKADKEKDAYMRQNTSMSRGGSRRGGNRNTAEAF